LATNLGGLGKSLQRRVSQLSAGPPDVAPVEEELMFRIKRSCTLTTQTTMVFLVASRVVMSSL
jgi:hypothetical protein